MTRLIFVLLVVAAPAFAAGSFLTPPVISSLSPAPIACSPDDSNDAEPAVDVYGNDVSSAVAEYASDCADGSYEVHSPQTQLSHLSSPKS